MQLTMIPDPPSVDKDEANAHQGLLHKELDSQGHIHKELDSHQGSYRKESDVKDEVDSHKGFDSVIGKAMSGAKELAATDDHIAFNITVNSTFFGHSLIETGSEQEIQTVRDYLGQLKTDIRGGASQYVQDSVSMMEELTAAIKSLKGKIEETVDRVNSKAEAKLLAIKAIEELIGFSEDSSKTFLQQHQSPKDKQYEADDEQLIEPMVGDSLIEVGSEQEIQTIKDYLEQLKTDIKGGASRYIQDSVSMMDELTTAIKSLKRKIEATVDNVNSKAEAKLLAIKAIEELIGFPEPEKEPEKVDFVQTKETDNSQVVEHAPPVVHHEKLTSSPPVHAPRPDGRFVQTKETLESPVAHTPVVQHAPVVHHEKVAPIIDHPIVH
jgi:archaellum component FlaC